MDEEKMREEMRAAAKKIPDARDSAVILPFGGCCWLSSGMVTECFNDFTDEECQKAARGCGCLHTFVPGGRCP